MEQRHYARKSAFSLFLPRSFDFILISTTRLSRGQASLFSFSFFPPTSLSLDFVSWARPSRDPVGCLDTFGILSSLPLSFLLDLFSLDLEILKSTLAFFAEELTW